MTTTQKLPFPRRHKNTDVRSREYLTTQEVERLRKAARGMGRHGHRNDTMILLAYRHGLRVGELVNLRWDQVDLQAGLLHVRRLKQGVPSTHPLTGREIRALRPLRRQAEDAPYVFLSERGGPMTVNNVQKMIKKAGEVAGLGFVVHPHMCRHGAGYKLANDGQDTRAIALWLGHNNLQHTMKYTELSPARFKDFWQD
jgi:type 1 fimbriae regulatory protein FimB/type 1 fimbriae regulatory protein FimE